MKEKRLLKAMGKVDEKYIEEASPAQHAKRPGWLKWGAMAACLCLMITGGFLYKAQNPYPVKKEVAPPPPGETSRSPIGTI